MWLRTSLLHGCIACGSAVANLVRCRGCVVSQQQIQKYLNELSDLRRIAGTGTEGVTSAAFADLLKAMGRSRDLYLIREYPYQTPAKQARRLDGALVNALRIPFGFWEAKDQDDDLDKEIAKKRARGYPDDNIVYEDTNTAVLFQNGKEVMRAKTTDVDELGRLLGLFFGYEKPEIASFRKAVEQFQKDLPYVLQGLREAIDEARVAKPGFAEAADAFLVQIKKSINPDLTLDDVREMLIQHILTEEIFNHVFDEGSFHRENNVAKALYELEATFFDRALKKRVTDDLGAYYAQVIRAS